MNILIVADEPPARPCRGYAASLHRLAVILLDNAIKYAGTGGAVTLRLAAAGSQAVLTVHNTGTPIPPDRLPHIFTEHVLQRFFGVPYLLTHHCREYLFHVH